MGDLLDRRVADYFIHCGLPSELYELDTPLEDFPIKPSHNYAPITDVTIIFPAEEPVPSGYKCVEKTPTGLSADLNHGSLRSKEVLLCYKRGWDKPPLVDVGVLYDGKEYVMPDSQVVEFTPTGRVANVNNSSTRTYITYRRADLSSPCNELVVTDICVIVLTKDEVPPHTYCIIPKTLNKGMVGSDVYICYKKSMRQPTRIVYKPGLLGRYPLEDREYFPLPYSVPLFCLPMGATVELWPAQAAAPKPVFSTFVFTVADGAEKVYGSSITFYERYPSSDLTAQQRLQLGVDTHHPSEVSINTNKSICLLSHWPFFDTFAKFLMFLHELSVSGRSTAVPLERYISHFLLEVPFPSVSRPHVQVQLDAGRLITVSQPHFSPLPQTGASFYELLRNLGPDNCLLLLTYTLAEQKLLLHSLRPDVLTRVAETVHLMIFPLQWQCPYIPLCPLGLADILSAPVPFLVGLDSRYFDMYDPPPDVTCIDLDTNTIFVAEEKRHVAAKLLPKKPGKVLRCTLDAVYNKLYSMNRKNKSSNPNNEGSQQRIKYQMGLEIQEAFLRFMTSVLRGYRSYLKPIKAKPQQGTTDPSSLFNMEGFLKSRDKACHPFYQMITPTQMFIRFIEERSFVTEKDAHLVFFDECLEKSIDSPDCCLLDMDNLQSERTVFVPPPEPMDKQFVYNEFGQLHAQLFMSKCTSLSQLSAPRASIVSTLGGPAGASPSPMVRRTKHEVISARKLALKQSEKPALWASHLIGTCFSLWFVHLPCYVESSDNPKAVMDEAFQLMISMQKILQNNVDEVCYRVIMQLCGQLSLPILAVKVLYRMKQLGVHPNALTYGYYNRAVLESEWPTDCSSPGRVLWVRLRNVVLASAEFRAAQKRRERKNIAATDRAPSNLSIVECDLVSTPSMGSAQSLVARRKEMKSGRDLKLDLSGSASFRARVGRIVRSCNLRNTDGALKIPSPNFDTSAGVLMVTCSDEMADAAACSPRMACQPPGLDSPHHDRSSAAPDLLESQAIDLLRCTNFAGDDSILERVRETRTAAARTPLSSVPGAAAEQPDSSRSPQLVRSLSTSQQLDRTAAPVSCSPRSVSDVTGDLLLAGAGGGGPRSCAEDSGSATSLSQRTAVTRNDPLGAFSNGSLSAGEQHTVQQSLIAPSDSRTGHARRNLFEAEPFLKGFSNPVTDDRAVNRSGSLRATSSSTSAGFRLPFSRIEQASNVAGGRLRMAERRFRKHFDTIQPDINGLMKSYSPTSLKNHELVKSGVSSIRSAATSMYKKLDEIKDAMSNQSPGLIKTMSLTSVDDDEPVDDLHLPIVSDLLPGSSETWSDTAFESQFSSKAALNTLLPDPLPSPLPPVALELCLTSCCRCYNCQTVVYDEQIMAGWTAEDSNLNSKCPLCRRPFVPLLTVNVLDLRNISRSERLAEELKPLEQCTAGIQLEAITVPYLSPLVLRKEVENVMEHDGVGCLSATQFVDQHPIIYWNMVWFMQRINGPSHLSGLCLSSNTLTQNWQPAAGWEDVDWRYVRVRCFWDNFRLHEEVARPLYQQLKEDPARSSLFDALVTERSPAKNMIYTVLTFVQYDRLDLVLQVLSEHIATRRLREKHVSVYWDILFLVHSALGRDNIDIISYDREYRRAFEALGPDVIKNFTSTDRPPRPAELYCRRVFSALDI